MSGVLSQYKLAICIQNKNNILYSTFFNHIQSVYYNLIVLDNIGKSEVYIYVLNILSICITILWHEEFWNFCEYGIIGTQCFLCYKMLTIAFLHWVSVHIVQSSEIYLYIKTFTHWIEQMQCFTGTNHGPIIFSSYSIAFLYSILYHNIPYTM